MSYTVFKRESNNFTDILTDPVIKKSIRMKMKFTGYLILELADDKSVSYMMLKYGDDAISMSHIIPDRTPIPNKDYVPIRKDRGKKLKFRTS